MPTPRGPSGEGSWQRIAAAVEAANADLMAQNAKMTRSLRRLSAQVARLKCERDYLLETARA